jgi:hypothetical protein
MGMKFLQTTRLKWLLPALCGLLTALSVHAAPVSLEANGTTATYTLIESVLGSGTTDETPDCAHPAFGPHITQSWDSLLGKYVFNFFIHVSPDNDRCIATITDRQRNEIKTIDKSPVAVQGFYGDTCTFRWLFKIDSEFKPSSRFTHIHQIKAGDGDANQPLITITPRAGSPEKLELIYAAKTGGGDSKLAFANLSEFKGQWIEATERILYATNGTYELTLKKVSDGTTLLSYTTNSLNMWRADTTYIRPKWGIYRSISNASALRDEEVRFADFSITKEAGSGSSNVPAVSGSGKAPAAE